MSRVTREGEREEQRIIINESNNITDKSYNRWHYSWRTISLRPDVLITQLITQWNDVTSTLTITCIVMFIAYLLVMATYPLTTRSIPWRGTLHVDALMSTLRSSNGHININYRDSLHASHCTRQYPDWHEATKVNIDRTYYIIVDLHNSEAIVVDMIHELMRLLTFICQSTDKLICSNVFLLIRDHESHDLTRKHIIIFASYLADLRIPHTIISHDASTSMVLFDMQIDIRDNLRSDHLIWLPNVLFCAEDILRLNSHISQSVDQACGLRFDMNDQHHIQLANAEHLISVNGSSFRCQWPWMDTFMNMDGSISTSLHSVVCCSHDDIVVMNAHAISILTLTTDIMDMCASHINAVVDAYVNVASRWDVYEALSSEPWNIR